ncbi:tetratricopeptide repeat protein [Aurantimonas sp. A3-2-R12]|uniref:tetratricopeptide repeat protein n=1 Tax=Aurantimonas sp. A3-2-R12 TaxID=3114362 RepID=UPI002E17925F|nr:tetratricopeptide repeat protein [Aurantimonas sp. A3-2-R12]
MRSEICEKLAVFCTALFGLATASAGPAALALGGAAVVLTLPSILQKLRQGGPEPQAMMKRLERRIAANYRDWARNGGDITDDQIPPMEAALAAVLPRLALDPRRVMDAGRDNSGLATIVLTEASIAAPGDLGSEIDPQQRINRRALHGLVVQTLAALDGDQAFEATMQPWFQREVFTRFDRLEATIERVALSASQQAELEAAKARAETELGSTRSLIDAFLQTILDRNVPPDQWPVTLMRLAADWKNAGQRIDALSASQNLLPELGELREQALEAYRQEDVDRVWSILSEIESKEAEAYERLLAHRSEIDAELDLRREGLVEAKHGKLAIALSTFRTEEAAHLLVEILDLETAEADRFTALRRLQDEWYVRGRDKGLNLDLDISIELARIAVERATNSDERGAALSNMAIALASLGERERGTQRLEQAADAFKAALEGRPRDRMPLGWAGTQNNLGNTLAILGQRETGTERLEQAVNAFLAALEEYSRDRVPLDWARTQNNLGTALRSLGERESGTERLEQAVDAYNAALEEHTRDRVPLDWAMTQNNLGGALASLGKQESGTVRLEQAIDAYRAALEERTRDRAPFLWAQTQENLAIAFFSLFQKPNEQSRLHSALDAVDGALEVYREAQAAFYIEKAERLRAYIIDAMDRADD